MSQVGRGTWLPVLRLKPWASPNPCTHCPSLLGRLPVTNLWAFLSPSKSGGRLQAFTKASHIPRVPRLCIVLRQQWVCVNNKDLIWSHYTESRVMPVQLFIVACPWASCQHCLLPVWLELASTTSQFSLQCDLVSEVKASAVGSRAWIDGGFGLHPESNPKLDMDTSHAVGSVQQPLLTPPQNSRLPHTLILQ